MDFRVLSLGDWMDDPVSGQRPTQAERFANLIQIGEWAERFGYGGFHLGEHHFCEYIVSNPVPLLAAVAARTERVKLSTGVSLLANRDPVLLAEDYATLDLISAGRMEMIVGRGNAFFECYRQMGQPMSDSRTLFEENLDLLLEIWRGEPVTWDGKSRAPLETAKVQPQPVAGSDAFQSIWIGGGSSEDSIRAAASRKLNLQLPGVFAPAHVFAPLAKLYRELYPEGKIGFTAHVHVREDGADAKRTWEPYHLSYLNWVWKLIAAGAQGAMPDRPAPTAETAYLDPAKAPALCGDPSEVADRICEWADALGGLDMLVLKFDGGNLPMADVERSMALVAGPVAERVGATLH